MDDQLAAIQVSLAHQDEQLKLLPEMRSDIKQLRDDVGGLKVKAGMVAAGISTVVGLFAHWLGGK